MVNINAEREGSRLRIESYSSCHITAISGDVFDHFGQLIPFFGGQDGGAVLQQFFHKSGLLWFT